MDALLYSPGLVEELLDAFEELLPYYHYFTALCSRGVSGTSLFRNPLCKPVETQLL